MAFTVAEGRAVVELLAHLTVDERKLAGPVAVVAESLDKGPVKFRSSFCQRSVDGRHHLRPPVLEPGHAHPGDVVGRHQAALAAGDTDAVVSTFTPDDYCREPVSPHYTHRGTDQLRSSFGLCFSVGAASSRAVRPHR